MKYEAIISPPPRGKSLINEWFSLDIEHRKFILRVRNGNGWRNAADPHYAPTSERDEDGKLKEVALWKKAEESGFVRCIDSYAWEVTNKYDALESCLLLQQAE